MSEEIVILKIGAEGGSITLYGKETDQDKWEYWVRTNELALYEDMDEDFGEDEVEFENGEREVIFVPQSRAGTVVTWMEALELLDKYPWHRLHPIFVDKRFAERVWDAVTTRGLDRYSSMAWKEIVREVHKGE